MLTLSPFLPLSDYLPVPHSLSRSAAAAAIGDGEADGQGPGLENGSEGDLHRPRLPPDTGKVLKRPPAWTDRVLYRADAARVRVEPRSYRRHELLGSDHRPVSALLHVRWDRDCNGSIAAPPTPRPIQPTSAVGSVGARVPSSASCSSDVERTDVESVSAGLGHGKQQQQGAAKGSGTRSGEHGPAVAPSVVLFDLVEELVVADKSALLDAGIGAWAEQDVPIPAGGQGSEGKKSASAAGVLRVCKTSQSVRRTDIDDALKRKLLAAVEHSKRASPASSATVTEIYGVVGLASMSFMSYLVVATEVSQVAHLPQGRALRITDTHIVCASRNTLPDNMEDERAIDEKEFGHLKDISAGWGLFYSPDFDITQTQQRLAAEGCAADALRRNASDHFLWNAHLLQPFLGSRHIAKGNGAAPEAAAGHPGGGTAVASNELEVLSKAPGMLRGALLSVVCGYVETVKVQVKERSVNLTVVSRRSRFRSGVRFFSRGVDDAGHVSNSVETEQIVACGEGVTSFVTVRGSIPVYWQEQEALVTLKPRPLVLAGKPHEQAMVQHFADLAALYGPVFMLSLIDARGNEGNIYNVLLHFASRALRIQGQVEKLSVGRRGEGPGAGAGAEAQKASLLAAFLPFDFHAECGKSASANAAKRIAQVLPIGVLARFLVARAATPP